VPSDYFVTLARYNAWANRRLYRACGRLSESEYLRNRLPAFGSFHATSNHILVADRVWLAQIEHMVNHQAHYRGKASALLAQTEVPPPLDLIRFVRQEESAAAC
jgi:uncharacterized damage-inducible protein DinB